MQRRLEGPKRWVEGFRRDLRVLEREIARQLESPTTCCGVTLAQCHALLELSSADVSLGGLAGALELDVSTLSRTVEGLVRAGLVERSADPADRRAVRLRLTAAGGERVATINEMCNRDYARVLGELGDSERRAVVRAVRVLGDLMRRVRTGASCCAKERTDGEK
jgi:DNA-binding MarR family transcriptional regulator